MPERTAILRLAENMPHFVWEADPDGTPLYANRRFLGYTGLSMEQVQAGGWLSAQHRDDACRVAAAWRSAVENGTDYDLESRFREAASGEYRWFRIQGNPVRDGCGRIIRWVGTCTDRDDAKRAEERLAKVASFPMINPNPIVEADLEGNVSFVNPAARRIFPDITDLGPLHPYLANWSDVTAACGNQTLDLPAREVSVGDRWYHQSLAYRGEDRCVRIYGLEITERKRAEQRGRLLSEVSSQLLASDQPQRLVESLCRKVTDHLGCQVFFNYLVDEASGRLHLNACAGIPDETVRHLEWLDYDVCACGCVARDGRRIVADHVQTQPVPGTDLVRSFGVQAYACHPLLNQGRVIGTLSFGSRTKSAFGQDELEVMRTVADQVAIAMQRLRLLETSQQHARAAEAANAAKDQFLANVSHELRTPMAAILGMTELALAADLNPTVRDYLKTAKESADGLLHLLNEILDFSRMEAGRFQLEAIPFRLRTTLDQTLKTLGVRACEKGLQLVCDLPEDLPDRLVGDPLRLRQILTNLVGNAIKFTAQGEVAVRVTTLQLPPEERCGSGAAEMLLQFDVTDTGIGISPDDQPRIFAPFTQADASMTRQYGGTGLGLAIASSLVHLMGGRIWVESELGRGSTFHFTARFQAAEPGGRRSGRAAGCRCSASRRRRAAHRAASGCCWRRTRSRTRS